MYKKKFTFAKRKLNEQLIILMTITIILLVCAMLVISVFSSSRALYQQTEAQMTLQLESLATSYEETFSGVESIVNMIQMDEDIQELLSQDESSWNLQGEQLKRYNSARQTIEAMMEQDDNLNFIVIRTKNGSNQLYSSNRYSITTTGCITVYKTDKKYASSVKSHGNLRFSYGNRYFHQEQYTGSFYSTLYSYSILNKEQGEICINITLPMLNKLREGDANAEFDLLMVEGDGKVIAGTRDIDKLDMSLFDDPKQMVRFSGNYYQMKRIAQTNYYLVSVIPVRAMYQNSLKTGVLIVLVALILLFVSLFVFRRLLQKSYEPMNRILDAMEHVREGNLEYRLSTDDMGPDFYQIGEGYNHMMDSIQQLMKENQRERDLAAQIKLNALHSQIQPHFLYNTLDCIRWQARSDGSLTTAKLIMALAGYYRICLSKGKDVISLRTELEHIQHYLMIQNARFGDIIAYVQRIPEELLDVQIPKMTLQPLVENSIYHGIKVKEGGNGTVEIEGRRENNVCLIMVSDSGQGMTQEQIDKLNRAFREKEIEYGYGVRNVNRRIELTFGDAYGLQIGHTTDGKLCVEIKLPMNGEAGGEIPLH